jgi:hypothetical protein
MISRTYITNLKITKIFPERVAYLLVTWTVLKIVNDFKELRSFIGFMCANFRIYWKMCKYAKRLTNSSELVSLVSCVQTFEYIGRCASMRKD